MKKTIEFQAKFDTKEFDQQAERLQKRIRQMYNEGSRPGSMNDMRTQARAAGIPGVQANAGGSFQIDPKVRQAIKELNEFSQKQYEYSEKINRAIKNREDQLKRLQEQERTMTRGSKEYLDVQERISKTQRSRDRLTGNLNNRQSAFSSAQDTMANIDPGGTARIAEAYRTGGISGAMRQGVGMMGGGLAAGASLAGSVSTIAAAAAAALKSLGAGDRNVASARGQASQIFSGEVVNSMMSGRSSDLSFYAKERRTALGRSINELGYNQAADRATGISAGAGIAGGALGLGAAALGTVALGPLGLLAAGGALAGGAYSLATDQRSRLGLMSTFGSESAQKKLNALQYSDMAQTYQQNLEAEKMSDPLKFASRERYFQSMGRDLEGQRSLGMDSNRFYGKFMQQGFEQGFSDDQTISSSQSILAAGGSTSVARGGATLANQLQRNMNLTNAGSVMGALGRNIEGDGAGSATLRILSEAVKLGFDKSENAQEMRDFVQATASFVSSRGSMSETDALMQSRIFASGFSSTDGPKTRGQIDAAQNAESILSGAASDASTPGGIAFTTKLFTDEKFKGLSTEDKLYFSGRGMNIGADDPVLKNLQKSGKISSAEDMAGQLYNTRVASVGGAPLEQVLTGDYANEDERQAAFAKRSGLLGIGTGSNAQTQRALYNRMRGIDIGAAPGDSAAMASVTGSLAVGSKTGVIQDAEMAAVAKSSELLNTKFLGLKDSMLEAAEAAAKLTTAQLESIERIQNMIRLSNDKTPDQLQKIFEAIPAPPSAGKAR